MKLIMALTFAAVFFCTTTSQADEEIKDCDARPVLVIVPPANSVWARPRGGIARRARFAVKVD